MINYALLLAFLALACASDAGAQTKMDGAWHIDLAVRKGACGSLGLDVVVLGDKLSLPNTGVIGDVDRRGAVRFGLQNSLGTRIAKG